MAAERTQAAIDGLAARMDDMENGMLQVQANVITFKAAIDAEKTSLLTDLADRFKIE